MEALLDHGADVLLETRDGVTAGELAAIRKNRQVILAYDKRTITPFLMLQLLYRLPRYCTTLKNLN